MNRFAQVLKGDKTSKDGGGHNVEAALTKNEEILEARELTENELENARYADYIRAKPYHDPRFYDLKKDSNLWESLMKTAWERGNTGAVGMSESEKADNRKMRELASLLHTIRLLGTEIILVTDISCFGGKRYKLQPIIGGDSGDIVKWESMAEYRQLMDQAMGPLHEELKGLLWGLRQKELEKKRT